VTAPPLVPAPAAEGSTPDVSGQTMMVVGAGAGIGSAAAQLLAARGVRVICVDRDADGVAATAAAIRASQGTATAVTGDVTDREGLSAALTEAVRGAGVLHGVVNCAGITGITNIRSHEIPIDDFDRVIGVNLRGALLVSQSVLPTMLEQGYGRLLHIASIAGKEGNAGMVSYSASKAGLIGMVKTMGKEYAGTGITVNALAPAVIRTGMVDQLPQEQVHYMTSKIPMGRLCTLAEVTELIAWILSPAASFTTGFTFDLTGGRATY
jgi:NAD(P)-dependent dehydrogenase (short-subunit alcohol dehydrogenase family)